MKVLERLNMLDSKENPIPLTPGEHMNKLELPPENDGDKVGSFPYRKLIGCLLYISVCTRSNIAFSVPSLARFVSKPGLVHWNAFKKILSYVKGTKDYGIWYGRLFETRALHVYVDASWGTVNNGDTNYLGRHRIDWSS